MIVRIGDGPRSVYKRGRMIADPGREDRRMAWVAAGLERVVDVLIEAQCPVLGSRVAP
ncbi:MAG: hypothetical protein IH986_03010 [Planctomycetes bacterium]|nr:hypothetical protein [Planctomycetota bacterium]